MRPAPSAPLVRLALLSTLLLAGCTSNGERMIADLAGEYAFTLPASDGRSADVTDVLTLRADERWVRRMTIPMMGNTFVDSGVIVPDPARGRLTLRSVVPDNEGPLRLEVVSRTTLRNEDLEKARHLWPGVTVISYERR